MWKQPITTRTIADVNFARDNPNDTRNLIGAMNASDWNRITGNMYEIAAILTRFGYNVILKSRNDWTDTDIPTTEEIEQIRADIFTLRFALLGLMDYNWTAWEALNQTWITIDNRDRTADSYFAKLPVPALPWTDFQKINDVETIMLNMLDIVNTIKESFIMSGTFNSGQQSYLPHFIDAKEIWYTWDEWDALNRTWNEIYALGRTADEFFRRSNFTSFHGTWNDINALNRTWEDIDNENRPAIIFFHRDTTTYILGGINTWQISKNAQ